MSKQRRRRAQSLPETSGGSSSSSEYSVVRHENGDRFEGRCNSRGIPDGFGIYCWGNSGDVFRGHFVDGVMHGRGVLAFASGDLFYGEWQRGEIRGPGRRHRLNGAVTEGLFHGGESVGTVRKAYAGDVGDIYEGECRNDMRHGYGTYNWAGDAEFVYVGHWSDDRMEGQGLWEARALLRASAGSAPDVATRIPADLVAESIAVTPDFRDDLAHNSLSYRGEFRSDQRHGLGRGVFRDGACYDGEWANSLFEGYGRVDYWDQYYEGTFHRGKRSGQGLLGSVEAESEGQRVGGAGAGEVDEDEDESDEEGVDLERLRRELREGLASVEELVSGLSATMAGRRVRLCYAGSFVNNRPEGRGEVRGVGLYELGQFKEGRFVAD